MPSKALIIFGISEFAPTTNKVVRQSQARASAASFGDRAIAMSTVKVDGVAERTLTDAALEHDMAAWLSAGPIKSMSLIGRCTSQIPLCLFSAKFGLAESLLSLDISRNRLAELPASIGGISSLTELDVSRNWLKALTSELGQLSQLTKLNALSNQLRPSTLCLDALVSLPQLRELDFRFNDKLGEETAKVLTARLPKVTYHVTVKVPFEQKLHAADRDATHIHSQLAPHCTPTLRRRLALAFGEVTNPELVSREEVMQRLLAHYEKEGPRAIRKVQGVPVSSGVCAALLNELKAWVKSIDYKKHTNDRPTISAQHYMIIRSPADFADKETAKAGKAAAKLARYSELWSLAARAMQEVDADFAKKYTAVAFTSNFEGSPHIDTQNIGPFYGMALGDFSDGNGALCVECSAREVAFVDTRNRLGKVDGRFPHWVAPYSGNRYSVIYYQTLGEPAPRTTAVFSGEALVDDPLTFCASGFQYKFCAETNTYTPSETDERWLRDLGTNGYMKQP